MLICRVQSRALTKTAMQFGKAGDRDKQTPLPLTAMAGVENERRRYSVGDQRVTSVAKEDEQFDPSLTDFVRDRYDNFEISLDRCIV